MNKDYFPVLDVEIPGLVIKKLPSLNVALRYEI